MRCIPMPPDTFLNLDLFTNLSHKKAYICLSRLGTIELSDLRVLISSLDPGFDSSVKPVEFLCFTCLLSYHLQIVTFAWSYLL